MDSKTIALCTRLIKRYHKLKNVNEKNKVRNEIFELIHPSMTKWVHSILNKKHIFIEDTELTSLSWDCFEYGLKYWKSDGTIETPNHFYAYTNYGITLWLKQKEDEAKLSQRTYLTNELIDSSKIFEIKQFIDVFKKSLPPKYQEIFDDALMSLCTNPPYRLRRANELYIPYYRYDEAKKIFKYVIKFMLNT
jgi:hypothetical protein